jgi:hypothetical protein
MWHRCELFYSVFAIRVEPQKRPFVAHLVAIVRRTEDRDELPVRLYLVPSILHLVRSHHKLEPVALEEICRYVRSKRETNTTLARRCKGQRPYRMGRRIGGTAASEKVTVKKNGHEHVALFGTVTAQGNWRARTSATCRLWVTPHYFRHEALVRGLAETVDLSDLVQSDVILRASNCQ